MGAGAAKEHGLPEANAGHDPGRSQKPPAHVACNRSEPSEDTPKHGHPGAAHLPAGRVQEHAEPSDERLPESVEAALKELEERACLCDAMIGWACGAHKDVRIARSAILDALREARLEQAEWDCQQIHESREGGYSVICNERDRLRRD